MESKVRIRELDNEPFFQVSIIICSVIGCL